MSGIRSKILVAVIAAITSLPANAEWKKTFEVDYVMGDGDNRVSARQAALEQIKLTASNQAGTYVQGTTTLRENGTLTESIQMLSASMVRLSATEERMAVNKAGLAVLHLKATAAVDENELARRIEAMRQDKEKERQLKQLQAEYAALQKEFSEIRSTLSSKTDQARIAELLAKQDSTIQRIRENDKTVSLVFERGTLLQMASRNTSDLDGAKRYLDDNFIKAIMRSPVTATIEAVEQNGNEYVALVRVGWTIDTKQVEKTLGRYLNIMNSYKTKDALQIPTYRNLNGAGKDVLSDPLFRYVARKTIELEIKIAGSTVLIPVLFMDNSFFHDCTSRAGGYSLGARGISSLCLLSQDPKSSSFPRAGPNPVRIRLSREDAERATRVDTSFVEKVLTE